MNNQAITTNWESTLKPTKHYIERYYERILGEYLHVHFNVEKVIKRIFRDMNERLLEREKNFLELFVNPQCNVIVPFSGANQLVIKNGMLITVLN